MGKGNDECEMQLNSAGQTTALLSLTLRLLNVIIDNFEGDRAPKNSPLLVGVSCRGKIMGGLSFTDAVVTCLHSSIIHTGDRIILFRLHSNVTLYVRSLHCILQFCIWLQ